MNILKLPSVIKPHHFARKTLSFNGSYNLADITPLQNKVDGGTLNINLNFDLKNKLVIATGTIDFSTKIKCVNCLELINFNYSDKLNIVFVSNDIKYEELDEYEIIYHEFGEDVKTFDLITEEVLLAIPMFAKHKELCVDSFDFINKDFSVSKDVDSDKKNPFAILKNIKTRK